MKIPHVIATLDKKRGPPPPVVTGMCAVLAARGHQAPLVANPSAEPHPASSSSPFELVYFPVAWGICPSRAGGIKEMMADDQRRTLMGEAAKQPAWRYDSSNLIGVLEDTCLNILGHS